MSCIACESDKGKTHSVREMMFGTRDEFHYFECDRCCCLSLIDPPADLSQYYPKDKYYSFTEDIRASAPRSSIRSWVKHIRDRAVCFDRGGLAGLISRRYPNQDATECRKWLRHTALRSHKARILDVGCGNGWHLSQLHGLGFVNLTGIDPYLPHSIDSGPIRIHSCSLPELRGQVYDFIMLHHFLEHISDQVDALKQIRKLLAPGGECMVRIPIVSRGPWKMYGTDWAEIDAPRHFVLHSELSMKIAAEAAGLTVKCIQYESESFSYAASELYRRGLSLFDTNRKCDRAFDSVFKSTEIQEFETLSQCHRIAGWAGRATFFLAPSISSASCPSVFFN